MEPRHGGTGRDLDQPRIGEDGRQRQNRGDNLAALLRGLPQIRHRQPGGGPLPPGRRRGEARRRLPRLDPQPRLPRHEDGIRRLRGTLRGEARHQGHPRRTRMRPLPAELS